MTTTWQSFLIEQGATFDGHQLNNLSGTAIEAHSASQNIITDLGPKGILQVTGDGAEKFLQGQLTCDVKALTTYQLVLGACCNNKGRMLTNFYLLRLPTCFWLIMDRSLVDPMIDELKKYCAFFKAEMTNQTDRFVGLGVAGPTLSTLLEANKLPQTSQNDQITCQLPGPPHRYQLWLPEPAATGLWKSLTPECTPVGYSQWQLLDIQAGLAWVSQQSQLKFIPQQFNMQATGGINFKKGCYTGQEIVARMQYLGKQKNHLYRIQYQANKPLDIMTPLHSHSHKSSIGQLVNSAATGSNQYEALAVLQEKAVAADDIYFIEQPNEKVTLLDLPYTV